MFYVIRIWENLVILTEYKNTVSSTFSEISIALFVEIFMSIFLMRMRSAEENLFPFKIMKSVLTLLQSRYNISALIL